MTKYDEAWKTLMSTPERMIELLRGYVHEDFVRELDFSSLERVNGSYVAESLKKREEDMVWKVQFQSRTIYIYVLLEFQSEEDPLMALRVMAYLSLFYQDLAKREDLKAGELPAVLPIVLYTGRSRWKCARDIRELVACPGGGLEHYTPQLQYLLIDVNTFGGSSLPDDENLLSALFALENSPDQTHTMEVIALIRQLIGPDMRDEVRRTISLWFKEIFSNARRPPELPVDPFGTSDGMIEQKVRQWYDEEFARGILRGREEGREEGASLRSLEIACAMKARGMDPAVIAGITGLSVEKIDEIH